MKNLKKGNVKIDISSVFLILACVTLGVLMIIYSPEEKSEEEILKTEQQVLIKQNNLFEQNKKKKSECRELGFNISMHPTGRVYCSGSGDRVMDCIKEYTNGLDEKYNNPDNIVSSEADYSNVVKVCSETFGEKIKD